MRYLTAKANQFRIRTNILRQIETKKSEPLIKHSLSFACMEIHVGPRNYAA